MARKPVTVELLVKRHTRKGAHPDDGRYAIHDLGPDVMPEVLSLAKDAKGQALRMLAIVLADVVYPPALPSMRGWLDDDDEELRLTAACGLDAALGKRFKVVDLVSGPAGLLTQAIAALRNAWDEAPAAPSTEAWLVEQRRKYEADRRVVPPPERRLSEAERVALYPLQVELKQRYDRLSAAAQHRLDHQAVERALPLWAAVFPDDDTLHEAWRRVGRHLDGDLVNLADLQEQVSDAIKRASRQANYSTSHKRYRDREAAAAYAVGQGVFYLISTSRPNRLVGAGFCRQAMTQAGLDVSAVRADLELSLRQAQQAADDGP
jgi:hypothetical protein